MRFLLEPGAPSGLDELLDVGRAAIEAGLDGLFITSSPSLPAPLITAAAVGAELPHLSIAVEVTLADRSPIELAEEAAVVDNGVGGRLILAVRPEPADRDAFPEALDLLRTALSARPFRWEGEHWTVPAGLPQNENGRERRLRVTPPPRQPRLEIWGSGPDAHCTFERALGHVADAEEELDAVAAGWGAVDAEPAAIGAPRGRRHRFVDPRSLTEELLVGRAAFGQDWAVVRGGEVVAAAVGREVRRQVQLDSLPPGLVDFWSSRRSQQTGTKSSENPIMENR